MQVLKRLYDHLGLSYPEIVLSDGDKTLTSALRHAFNSPEYRVNLALCVWHINNNITTNCKKLLPRNELFMKRWKTLRKAETPALLEEG
jgi:hypothetical protein